LKVLLFKDFMNSFRNLLVNDVFDIDAWKYIFNQNIELDHISKGKLTDSIDSKSFNQNFTFNGVIDIIFLLEH